MSDIALGSLTFADMTLSLVLHTDKAPNDVEWGQVLDFYRAYGQEHSGDFSALRVLVVIDGGGPNAKQRADLMTAKNSASVKTAIISDSTIIRGIATAFNWLTGDTSMRMFAPTELSTALRFLDLPWEVMPKVVQALSDVQKKMGRPVRCLAIAVKEDTPAAVGTNTRRS